MTVDYTMLVADAGTPGVTVTTATPAQPNATWASFAATGQLPSAGSQATNIHGQARGNCNFVCRKCYMAVLWGRWQCQ